MRQFFCRRGSLFGMCRVFLSYLIDLIHADGYLRNAMCLLLAGGSYFTEQIGGFFSAAFDLVEGI